MMISRPCVSFSSKTRRTRRRTSERRWRRKWISRRPEKLHHRLQSNRTTTMLHRKTTRVNQNEKSERNLHSVEPHVLLVWVSRLQSFLGDWASISLSRVNILMLQLYAEQSVINKIWNNGFISSYFLLQQMRKKARAAVVRGCIMVRTDATLLLLHHSLETKNFQLPEPPFPGSITMETTGLKGTCPVSRDKVNPGFTGCRACRGTEGVRKPLYILQALYCDCTREQWEAHLLLIKSVFFKLCIHDNRKL